MLPSANLLETTLTRKLAGIIPGFGGYLDREQRRRDDRATRDYLAERIQECKRDLQAYLRPLADQGAMEKVLSGERVREQLELLQQRTLSAMEGYSSWFDSNQIDSTKLNEVLDLDNELISVVDRIHQELKTQISSTADFTQLHTFIQMYRDRFSRRGLMLGK